MGLTSIVRGFAAMLLALCVCMLAPLFLAIAGDEPGMSGYLFGVIASASVGCGAYAMSQGRRPPSDFRGALVIILLWWLVVPVFAAIPFATGPLTYSEAYFEAVTAMTTTGGWLSYEGAIASPAGMLWRAQLQWLGGLASISIAAAIFIRPAFIGIDTLLPPFSRGDKDSFLRPLRNAVLAFSLIYFLITALAAGLLMIAGAPTIEAVVMALSGVASGGFLPRLGGVESYSPAVGGVLFLLLIFGGANFVLIARVLRGARERARDIETGAYLAMIIIVAVLFWVLAGAGNLLWLGPQLFNAASILSTNGYTIGEAPPVVVVLVTAIIGGCAVSTAGGFKILRWLVIMRRAREEVARLIAPSAVFGKRRVSNELGVWIHFLVFTMTLAALLVAVAVAGHPLELAAAAATASLSNTGPLITLVEGGADGYQIFSEPLRWIMLGGMVLGRLEAAVALALINRAFWRAI
ncbi:MAG: Trk system potassium uptake protein [Hyphococcus sp.]|nr:MAG: Trk system potassium uptake protein [Marinicaulis sp.]